MGQDLQSCSALMARLTLSALEKASKHPDCWEEPAVYRALLVSGLSVLIVSTQLVKADIDLK